jgi:hypothetical protein
MSAVGSAVGPGESIWSADREDWESNRVASMATAISRNFFIIKTSFRTPKLPRLANFAFTNQIQGPNKSAQYYNEHHPMRKIFGFIVWYSQFWMDIMPSTRERTP